MGWGQSKAGGGSTGDHGAGDWCGQREGVKLQGTDSDGEAQPGMRSLDAQIVL